MQKIGDSTSTANGAGEYTQGQPGSGIDATMITAAWLNAVQRELVNLIIGAGIPLDPDDDEQVLKAIQAIQTTASTWAKLTGKPTTVSGFGITDAFTKAETGTAIQQAVAALIASSPAALDTLKELADALGNDPNFATTITNALAAKASIASIQSQSATAFTSAGTAPAFTLTPVPAIDAYAPNQRFQIKFHAAGAGSDTINISGKGPKALKQYDSAGNKVAAVIQGQVADAVYDGTDVVLLDALPAKQVQLQPFDAAVAANALTLTLNPTTLDFRSTWLSSGALNKIALAVAISLTIPAGATLGTVNAVSSRLVVLALCVAGGIELAVANYAGQINFDETTLISTTAISAASNSDGVIYSAVARTNVPFRVVGFTDLTQAAAGTWATAPSLVQPAGGQAAVSGLSRRKWKNLTGVRVPGTTYTNTDGLERIVSIANSGNPYQQFTLYVDGVGIALSNSGGINYSQTGVISEPIPPGSTYSVSITTGGLSYWCEFRQG